MNFNELSTLTLLIFLLLTFFLFNFNNNLQSLIVSELVWVTLFIFALVFSFLINNVIILSLTFFFLVFSAIEISVGLVLINTQKLAFNSIKNFQNTADSQFNVSRFLRTNYLTKFYL